MWFALQFIGLVSISYISGFYIFDKFLLKGISKQTIVQSKQCNNRGNHELIKTCSKLAIKILEKALTYSLLSNSFR